jgi:hypothetical protein
MRLDLVTSRLTAMVLRLGEPAGRDRATKDTALVSKTFQVTLKDNYEGARVASRRVKACAPIKGGLPLFTELPRETVWKVAGGLVERGLRQRKMTK